MGKSKLTKSELVDLVFNKAALSDISISKQHIAVVVSEFVETLRQEIEKLNESERIELRGFGTFGMRYKKARKARNPKTNEIVHVSGHRASYFKVGRRLRSIDR